MNEFEHIMSMQDKLSKYIGKWIAVINNEIVAEGKDSKKVYEEAKSKYPETTPFMMLVPQESVMLL